MVITGGVNQITLNPMTPTNHTIITLGELLSHPNNTIKRNAISILKTLQKEDQKPKDYLNNQSSLDDHLKI